VGTSSSALGLLVVLVSVNACCLAALPCGFPTRRFKTRMCSAAVSGHPRGNPDAGVSRHVRHQTVSTKSAFGATIIADATEWPTQGVHGALFLSSPRLFAAVLDVGDPLSPVTPAAKSLIAAGVAAGVLSADGAAEQDEPLVVGLGNERITRRVLRCFRLGEWLEDENNNGVLSMLQRRKESDVAVGRAVPVCLFLNTFLYQQLTNGGRGRYTFDGVRLWTALRELLSVHLLFVVINHGGGHGNHWTLAVVHTVDGAVEHCDSNGREHPAVTSIFGRWFRGAVRNRGSIPPAPAVPIDHGAGAPQQSNNNDCGVSAVSIASVLAWLEAVADVTARRMVYFRLHFAAEFLASGTRA